MNPRSAPAKISLTSWVVMRMASGAVRPRRCSSSRIRSRLHCRRPSLWTSFTARPARGTPLISQRSPPRTLTFTSWRLAPMPVRTRPVLRATSPQSRIASRTSSGVRSSGPVTVSVSGMPRRSVRQMIWCPLSFTSRHESSSTLTCVIVSGRPLKGSHAVDADDGRPLEARGNRPVEVLLSGDVDLVDDVHIHRQAQLDGHVDGLLVHQKRRRVVHLVGADVLRVQEVDDLLLRLELHQSRAVVLAQLREGRTHVSQHFAVVRLGVEPRGTATEQLLPGQELLVHLQPRDQAHRFVVQTIEHPGPFLRVEEQRVNRHFRAACIGRHVASGRHQR